MKSIIWGSAKHRYSRQFLLVILFVFAFVVALSLFRTRAASPASGTITATSATPITWNGTATGVANTGGEGGCVEGDNCDTFTLTVAGTAADWTNKRIQVSYGWINPATDYDLYIHKGSNAGEVVDSSTGGAPSTSEVAFIDPAKDGTGVFTVHAVYFTVAPGDQYHGTAQVLSTTEVPPVVPPPPAPQDPGPKIGYENHEAPGVLTEVTSSSQGPAAKTVEYLGHDAGEPSIGSNWKTGVTAYQSDLQTLFVSFNDNCPSNGQVASWINRPAPTSQLVDSDPIGFTDRLTGRTFAGQLTLLSPTCKMSFTDDDGRTWIATEGSGIPSSVDHQTIGGGPFHAPLTRPTNVPGLYPNAVYYCSQLPDAACSRSDDGGLTYGPSVPVDGNFLCGGLHGHIKVAPDGTAYLPNNNCRGSGAVLVSEDNGITWEIREVKNNSARVYPAEGLQDPAVGVDNSGRVYFVASSGSTAAAVATSDDQGRTWRNIFDVGAVYGLQNIAFPAAVAADTGRAAVAFYGSTTPGNAQSANFKGVWHLYVAHTFDGGNTWTTSDATPNAPMQRGCIWMGGGANICRNLLDFFDMTVDKQGRVQVGYVNGCAGGNCAQASATANGNAYTATAVIARQSSGRRLVAAYDPLSATTVPGIPSLIARRDGTVVYLRWSEADTGNLPIQKYKILRGTASGQETQLAMVNGSQTKYTDDSATDKTKTYYYQVVAVNKAGSSCRNNEVAVTYNGDSCTGLILQRTPPGHPESALANANPALAIDYIAMGEPPGTTNLMFKMKVATLSSLPANSRWRIVWNTYASAGQQFFVGMRTDGNGVPTFEYGEVATGVVGLVIGVPIETKLGNALPESNYNSDGTITIYVPRGAVGNPQPGDLLGAVNGRTFTADNDQTRELQRSTLLIDHTFVKAQRDNGAPAATYTVTGNASCSMRPGRGK